MPTTHPCDWRRGRSEDLRAYMPDGSVVACQGHTKLHHLMRIRAAKNDPRQPSERWHARGLSLSSFGLPEPFLIPRQNGADHRMVRLIGLHHRLARCLCPSGTSRDLPHQLKGPFRRAQIRSVQPEIGVDHPDQSQQRKVMPFGHQLRADDDVTAPRRDAFDLGLKRACRSEPIR